MVVELKPTRKTARLSVTSCEPEFREEVQRFAVENGISESQLIRVALRFFLDANVGKTDIVLGKSNKKRKKAKAAQS